MRDCAVALVQMQAVVDADPSLAQALDLTRDALDRRPDLIVLPENYSGMGGPAHRRRFAFDPSMSSTHPAIAPFIDLSKHTDTLIVLGGTPERGPDVRHYNTSLALYRGRVVATYRKVHLFDLERPQAPVRESDYTAAGRKPVVLETPWASVGMSVCFDLRFPHFFAALAAAGAEMMLVPSAFTLRTGMDHWEVLLRARAIETQCYVAAAAQWGPHGGDRESYGHSMVVDPWGTVVARASAGPGLVWADLRAEVLVRARALLPTARSRTPIDETSVVRIPLGGGGTAP